MAFIGPNGPPFIFSVRFLITVLSFFSYAAQYMQKIDLSVAIVCMINSTWIAEQKQKTNITNTTEESNCFFKSAAKHSEDGPFEWSPDIQGLVLASYFWGYLITEIPGGWLSMKFGTKYVLLFAIGISSIATILMPVGARGHYAVLIVLRFITGLAQGVIWPAMASLWAEWAPPSERSRMVGFSSAGSQVGSVIALPLGGYLCTNGFDEGWGSIFYIYGIVGCVWCLLWFFLASSSAEDHKFITKAERAYILKETEEARASHSEHESLASTPWKAIFKSKAVWSLFVTHFCNCWGTFTFLTNIPTYMKDVLKFDIHSNGILSAVPYLCFGIVTVLSSNVANIILTKTKMSRTILRKITNSLSNLGPMGAVIGLIFVTCENPYVGVALLSVGLGFTGFGYGAGFIVNSNDIAAGYAGVVFGIANTFGTIPGIVSPYLIGVIAKNKLQSEWRIVFIIAAVIYCVGALSAIFFCSGETEPWAKKTPIERKTEKSLTHLNSLGIHLNLEEHGVSMNNVRSIHKSLNDLKRAGSSIPVMKKNVTVMFEDPRLNYDDEKDDDNNNNNNNNNENVKSVRL